MHELNSFYQKDIDKDETRSNFSLLRRIGSYFIPGTSSDLHEKMNELRLLGVPESDLKEMRALKGTIKATSIIPSGGAAPSRIAQDRRAPRFK